MADKAITELVAADQITATDLFVLQQNDTAKKLPGQVLLNWLTAAADGHGGIQSYDKLKTEGLVKTYRFTLADQTHIDIDVVDGRGINAIEKVSTAGLVDTYRIRYNDNTTGTFTVTNGAKGDKGDNTYTWIRYASQQPTAQSHSFGELPDAWIGIYAGTASSAPTDWQEYAWYQWKGDKGDTGEPATLISSEIRYQTSESGIIVPSGTWSESVPNVLPGRYLWTRQVIQFNTGAPVISYSVSRFGIDGTGAVASVAGVAPDPDGNVPLDASHVKALALAGGDMQGPINMSGQKLRGLNEPAADDEAASKGYVDTNKVDKSKVTSSFDITAEGYVADARALKTLNDGKTSAEILWKNASPSSGFKEQRLYINGVGNTELYPWLGVQTEQGVFIMKNSIGAKSYLSAPHGLTTGTSAYIKSRTMNINDGNLYFFDAVELAIKSSGITQETLDSLLIPEEIYGFKGVPV